MKQETGLVRVNKELLCKLKSKGIKFNTMIETLEQENQVLTAYKERRELEDRNKLIIEIRGINKENKDKLLALISNLTI